MNLYILYAIMINGVEVSTYLVNALFDIVEVILEPFHKGSFGLAYILYFAFFTSYTIY